MRPSPLISRIDLHVVSSICAKPGSVSEASDRLVPVEVGLVSTWEVRPRSGKFLSYLGPARAGLCFATPIEAPI